jgi:hypothetical protein
MTCKMLSVPSTTKDKRMKLPSACCQVMKNVKQTEVILSVLNHTPRPNIIGYEEIYPFNDTSELINTIW